MAQAVGVRVPPPVHAIEPGFRRAFAYGYGGTPSVHVTPPLTFRQGRYFFPEVLVQVHFLDPYKHFQPFLLAPVHVLDLYEHQTTNRQSISSRNPGILSRCRGSHYADRLDSVHLPVVLISVDGGGGLHRNDGLRRGGCRFDGSSVSAESGLPPHRGG